MINIRIGVGSSLGSLFDRAVSEAKDASVDERRGSIHSGQTEESTQRAAHLVETRHEGEEFVVLADIPGATRADLTTGIDPDRHVLVIARDGRVLERVPLPFHDVSETEASFNHGVLEIRVSG